MKIHVLSSFSFAALFPWLLFQLFSHSFFHHRRHRRRHCRRRRGTQLFGRVLRAASHVTLKGSNQSIASDGQSVRG